MIGPALTGADAADQRAVDRTLVELDGTANKARLGANAILGCSLAVAKAAAADAGQPLWRWIGGDAAHVLPVPLMNVVNGGAHAQNSLDVQEFMVVPLGAASFSEALRIGAEIFHHLRALLHERGLATAVGDEGGFAPDLARHRARDRGDPRGGRAGRPPRPGGDRARRRRHRALARRRLPFDGEGSALDERRADRATTRSSATATRSCRSRIRSPRTNGRPGDELTGRLGDRVQLVGDDLFVTNVERLERGIELGVGERDPRQGQPDRDADGDARRDRARPPERLRGDHLAPLRRDRGHDDRRPRRCAVNAGQIKTGAPSRTDRVAKYNQLLRIEEALGPSAAFAGAAAFRRAGG